MKNQSSNIINWPLCVDKLSGNKALASELLAFFVEELAKNRLEFLSLYEQSDLIGLEKAAHKLQGGCCFCGVPNLQYHVTMLESLAEKATELNHIQPVFDAFIQSIDDVLHEYNSFYLNNDSKELTL